MSNVRQKDPNASLKFFMDYSDHLANLPGGLTITDSTWIVPVGITEVDSGYTASTTWIWLADGTDGEDYELVNNFTLSDGQTDQSRMMIQVREKDAGLDVDSAHRVNALTLLRRWVQPDVVPPLQTTDIEAILDDHKIAETWKPNTFYGIGQHILPPVRTGWYYDVVQPGTSQAGVRAFSEWPTHYGYRLGDGSSDPQLILEAAGGDTIFQAVRSNPLSINVYDVRAAARECIQQRLQLGVHLVDNDGVSLDQITKHLEGLLKRFNPIRFPVLIARG